MKINNIIKINFLFVLLALFACESLEDTYKDYSGDGKIKYAGKCKSFNVTAGWKRFVFDWEASPDSNIKEIQIHWSCDEKSGIYTISADKNSFNTEATFEDYPYTFECYGVDKDGNRSIPIVQYSRPFTLTHELVLGFPKMINKYIFLGNDRIGYNLVLFFDYFNENIKSTTITYFQNGQQKEMNITKEMFDDGHYLIEGVDINKDVIVNRNSRVEGCIDDVVFDPFVLKPDFMNFNFDFGQEIKNRYNLEELTPEFVKNLKVLELNYSLKSLEDIMYFPNLEQVILGGNRYTVPEYEVTKISELNDKTKSIFALTEVNKKLGVEVIIHNNHYKIENKLPFVIKKGDPTFPTLSYLDTNGWSVKSSSKEGDGDDAAEPQNILDNDPATLWRPQSVQNYIRTHELMIDMLSEKTVNGFKISQPNDNKHVAQIYFSDIIRIEISADNVIWENALFQFQPTIGLNFSESTVLYTPEPKIARYIKITLTDKYDSTAKRNNTCLGDFMVF